MIRRFFMVLGVLFFIQLVGVGYLVIADPFNLRPLVSLVWQASGVKTALVNSADSVSTGAVDSPAGSTQSVDVPTSTVSEEAVPATKTATVNSEQTKALQSVGLDASAIADITPAQESCFVSILGAVRVGEIKAGAVPTTSEFFSVRSCL